MNQPTSAGATAGVFPGKQPAAPRRPVLRWHGGKFRLAPWIVGHLPPHRIYVEPFGGAGSVLMRKPRAYSEVYNDLDGEVVNLFRVLRDRDQARELTRLLRLTPFARAEFEASYETALEPVESARRLVVRCFMGFGSAAHNSSQRTGFRAKACRHNVTGSWRTYAEAVAAMTDRLRGVLVENQPALTIIERHDSPDTLFYVDPPYPHATRRPRWPTDKKRTYRHELTDDDHRELAATLRNVAGTVVISGYRCPLYDELYAGWRRVEREAWADGARPRKECLWVSPRAVDLTRTLFDEEPAE